MNKYIIIIPHNVDIIYTHHHILYSVSPLVQIVTAIKLVFVLVFVGIAELISPSSVKKNSEPIIAEVLPVVVIQPTSTEPYRFDPKSRGPASTTPQFVLLSFDGSKSIEMWRETVDFAESMNANGAPLHFTYFINSAYFLAFENRGKYLPLYGKPGDSMIGFAESIQSINERVKGLNRAVELGHEIGSHTAGHWDGKNWSVNDWCKEHNLFIDLLFNFENKGFFELSGDKLVFKKFKEK